jgi:hypothetical protein
LGQNSCATSRKELHADAYSCPDDVLDAWGKRLKVETYLPQGVGETNECWVPVGDQYRYLMRLLMLRVSEDVAKRRRAADLAPVLWFFRISRAQQFKDSCEKRA